MVNDVITYDEMLCGDSMAGFFVAIQTFVPKIVLAASLSLPLAFLAAVGFGGFEFGVGLSEFGVFEKLPLLSKPNSQPSNPPVEPMCPPDADGLIHERCEKVSALVARGSCSC